MRSRRNRSLEGVRPRCMIGLATLALLFAIGAPAAGATQNPPGAQSAETVFPGLDTLRDTAARQSAAGSKLPRKQRKVSQPLGELRPLMVWEWGPVLATVLAMAGAIVLTLPVAMAYMWTKPEHEYDPGVMHSSIILAPTIAGLLIVIQGSLAMAFSLAGVATAVRFRNSLKDTNDAVYVFVAVAIGLAAGVQALDIALAISLIFAATVVLLSRSPFRKRGGTHQAEHSHHHHHHQHQDGTGPDAGPQGKPLAEGGQDPMLGNLHTITIRTADPAGARAVVEPVLGRETKRWRLERTAPDPAGAATLVYLVRCRKRAPYYQLLATLKAAPGSQAFAVEEGTAPGLAPAPAA